MELLSGIGSAIIDHLETPGSGIPPDDESNPFLLRISRTSTSIQVVSSFGQSRGRPWRPSF